VVRSIAGRYRRHVQETDPRPPLAYRVTRRVARLLLRVELRRVEASGAERVPAVGPVLLVANHHRGLVDSMAILSTSPRPAGPMAKAPLWKHGLLRRCLDAVEAVPVYRPQDAAENEGRGARANLETFAECIRRLRAGKSIVLFPEGMSRPSPRLLPLRTGAARIALDAEVPVAVVPVGLSYVVPAAGRGSVLVRYGDPFTVDGRAPAESRRAAVAAVTRRIEAAIRALLAEADDLEDVALLRMAAAALAGERGESLDARERRVHALATAFEALRTVDPVERQAIRAAGAAFARRLAVARVSVDLLDRRYGAWRVTRFVLSTLLLLAVAAPVGFLATVVTAPARWTADIVALRRSRAAEDALPFARLVGRVLFVGVETVVLAAVLGVLVSPWVGLAALVGVPSLFAIHLAWRDRRADAARRVRAFALLAGGRLRSELRAERDALVARIEAAGRRASTGTPSPPTG
jgi:glycerol-3-phosphate O-acyltransferase / dihydroxyacetone phosphate acyltransferase